MNPKSGPSRKQADLQRDSERNRTSHGARLRRLRNRAAKKSRRCLRGQRVAEHKWHGDGCRPRLSMVGTPRTQPSRAGSGTGTGTSARAVEFEIFTGPAGGEDHARTGSEVQADQARLRRNDDGRGNRTGDRARLRRVRDRGQRSRLAESDSCGRQMVGDRLLGPPGRQVHSAGHRAELARERVGHERSGGIRNLHRAPRSDDDPRARSALEAEQTRLRRGHDARGNRPGDRARLRRHGHLGQRSRVSEATPVAGKWSVAAPSALEDGEYTAQATESSSLGNGEGKSGPVEFEIFTRPPAVKFTKVPLTRSKQNKPAFEGTTTPGKLPR